MDLSKRLSLIGRLVPAGSSVCDVGTDHGYLPAFLYKSGKCKSICATDIKEKPLKNAERNLQLQGIQDINLYLCDGLSCVTREMADTVIIAGMGGEVISGIIDRAVFLRDPDVTLILQPTTSADKLRDFMAKNGFKPHFEQAVKENGKIYSVAVYRYCGCTYSIDNVRRVIGLITPDYSEGRAYIEKQYSIANSRAEQLKAAGKITPVYLDSADTAQKLKEILYTEGKNGI